jgi:hypothetical protein
MDHCLEDREGWIQIFAGIHLRHGASLSERARQTLTCARAQRAPELGLGVQDISIDVGTGAGRRRDDERCQRCWGCTQRAASPILAICRDAARRVQQLTWA